MPVSKDFVRFVNEIAAKNSKELDLSLCPGVDATSPSKFDFLSIALALRNNSYFEYEPNIESCVTLKIDRWWLQT